MRVNCLKLNDFRNYNSAYFEFDPSLNIIIGNNGIGKTSILESLIVVSNTKSFKTLDDKNLIKNDKEYARIELESDVGKFKVVINDQNKSLYFNNNLIKKTSDFIGKLNCVLFKPSDLELFNQSPKERRKILDVELGKISKNYLTALLRYNLLLKDKNKILKEEKINDILLSLIEIKMIPEMEIIIKEREKFFEFINNYLSNVYKAISGEQKELKIKYLKCSEIDNLKENIEKSRSKDLMYRYATLGIHHDDYEFLMDDKDINDNASQGQRRMALIAFKVALSGYIKHLSGGMPILLLDDVLSELDIDNQKRLLNLLPKDTQTIITNTDIKKLSIDRKYKLIELKEKEYGQY